MAYDSFGGKGIIPQFDGSKFANANCACATAAMHAVSECQGVRPPQGSPWRPTGASIRLASGDTSGGLKPSQIDATLNRVYAIDLDFRVAPAGLVLGKLDDGYAVTNLRSEGPIVDAGFVGSSGFRGNHSSLLTGARGEGASLKAKDCNPLYDGRHANTPRGPQWVPWPAVIRASELLVITDQGERMIDRYGAGMMLVGIGRTPYLPGTPTTTIRYSVAFSGAAFYVYTVVNGVIIRRTPTAFSGPTSARCTAPRAVPWPGHISKRLVQMSAGVLRGKWVAVPQGGAVLVEKVVAA